MFIHYLMRKNVHFTNYSIHNGGVEGADMSVSNKMFSPMWGLYPDKWSKQIKQCHSSCYLCTKQLK